MVFIPIHDANPLRSIKRPYVTWMLLITNVLVYFLIQVGGFVGQPSRASVFSFGLTPAYFFDSISPPTMVVPDLLALITYSFLHGDFWHLAGNMIFLWVLGDNVEDALGHLRYFAFYILCAMAAGYAYVLSDPTSQSPVIGASGAVAGNVAAYLILHPRAKMWVLLFARVPLRLRAVYVLGIWIVFQVGAVFAAGEGEVAWWSHIGGLATGAVLVVLMRRRGVKLFDRGLPAMVAATPEEATPATPTGETPAPSIEAPPINHRKGPWE